jgi:hypothetical protein
MKFRAIAEKSRRGARSAQATQKYRMNSVVVFGRKPRGFPGILRVFCRGGDTSRGVFKLAGELR